MSIFSRVPALVKRPTHAALGVYLLFTLVAIVGYLTFGLNPELLAGWPALAAFYSQSFTVFAQGHILLAAAVLGPYLVLHAKWHWLGAFATVYVVSFLSEFVGTGYGLPFGHYHYTDLLGVQWFGQVPVLIPLSWFLMALPAYVIVRHWMPEHWSVTTRVLLASFLFVIWDLSLDPAMSYQTSYWIWDQPGLYYGMPMINLVGWVVTALVLMALIEALSGRWVMQLSPRWMAAYYGITLLMPLGMVAAAGLWLPVVLTAAGLALGVAVLGAGHNARDKENSSSYPDAQPIPKEAHADESIDTEPISLFVEKATAGNIFERHARSFSFAAWLFPWQVRRRIACLYAFCRTTDDIVDCANGRKLQGVQQQLEAWRRLAHRAYAGEDSGIDWLNEIMAVSSHVNVPSRLIDDLIEGVQMDMGRVDIQTMSELDDYSYRVASVVGIWMCHLAGVHDAATLKQAASMGRAMQLTNIIRDVGEDLSEDRIYLPAEMRTRYNVTEADLHEMRRTGAISEEYRDLIDGLMGRANAAYDRAFPELAALPLSYARASAVAAEIYRGIHQEVRRNGYDNLRHRAYTGSLRKVWLTLRGLLRLHRCRRAAAADKHAEVRTADSNWTKRLFQSSHCWLLISMIALLPVPAAADTLTVSTARAFPTSTWSPFSQVMDLDSLRDRYVNAVEDEAVLEQTLDKLKQDSSINAVEEAYMSALIVLRAKHAFWPHSKVQHLRDGLPRLDVLVREYPDHAEIRYLRLLSCYFLPNILGRSDSVSEDFDALARLLPEARSEFPPELYREMVRFVLDHGEASGEQRSTLVEALRQAESTSRKAREESP